MNEKLKSFLSKLPSNVTKDIVVNNNKIKLPSKLDIAKFEKVFTTEIHSNTLTNEKAIYAAYLFKSKEDKDSKSMLLEYAYKS